MNVFQGSPNPRKQDAPILAPVPSDEWLAGWPRTKNPNFSIQEPSNRKSYVRNMGDDTPIRAYSLRDDYERNAEWYPTKTIRDWKTTDIKDEYPQTVFPQKGPLKKKVLGTQLRSSFVFDRSRG